MMRTHDVSLSPDLKRVRMNTPLMRRRREALGLSEEDIAKALGRDRSTVNRWLNGAIVPDTRLLRTLAQLLGVTVDDLLAEPDPEPEPAGEVAS